MIYSFCPFGYEGSLITVEVDLRRGIPAVDIVGIADCGVKELRERVIAAIRNSGMEFPSERVLISLSPADLRKKGAGFDLPTALEVVRVNTKLEMKDDVFVMGELELSGKVRDTKAVAAGLQTAYSTGIHYAIIPHTDNLQVPNGMKVRTVESLVDAYYALKDLAEKKYDTFTPYISNSNGDVIEFDDLYDGETPLDDVKISKGDDGFDTLNGLKYAMAVAVAGRHSILAFGSPGCGKTMVLQRMTQLMPRLLDSELPTVRRVYSVAGMPIKGRHRPFRMPHQTASIEGICGGGVGCRPGEMTLAHNGVLFLDEAVEFKSSVLQMLRVPLELHQITLCRAGRTTVYPARFQLAMATNPCPCGNYGSKDKICLCSAKAVEQYWKKLSGPLLDRVAIRWNCSEKDWFKEELSLADLRKLIKTAWETQLKRTNCFNEDLNAEDVEKYVTLNDESLDLLRKISEKYSWTTRVYNNVLKVARTIADMSDLMDVTTDCIRTAIKLHTATPLEDL